MLVSGITNFDCAGKLYNLIAQLLGRIDWPSGYEANATVLAVAKLAAPIHFSIRLAGIDSTFSRLQIKMSLFRSINYELSN